MPKTILLAATDPNIIYLLQRYAEASGFQPVTLAPKGDLFHQAFKIHPDLIVLEIELPDTTAKLSLEQLKANPDTSRIPVLVYSCFDEITSSNMDGVSGCLQKSLLYSDFQAAVALAGVHASNPTGSE